MASVSLFCLNASSGYLSLAAARAGEPNDRLPRPTRATAPAPCRITRRDSLLSLVFINGLLMPGRSSKGLQEIHDRVDLLLGQNPVSSERRHHGQRITLGFVEHDGEQLVALVLVLHVGQFRSDRAGIIAALDDMADQAIALAAVEGELLALRGGLGKSGAGCGKAGQQRQ